MDDSYESVAAKVATIFNELTDARARTLNPGIFPSAITSTITSALLSKNDSEEEILQKDKIAFHMTDWSGDAAFLVALHLFPERFTPEEIRAGIDSFLIHVPGHVIAAARLSGKSTEDFSLDERSS